MRMNVQFSGRVSLKRNQIMTFNTSRGVDSELNTAYSSSRDVAGFHIPSEADVTGFGMYVDAARSTKITVWLIVQRADGKHESMPVGPFPISSKRSLIKIPEAAFEEVELHPDDIVTMGVQSTDQNQTMFIRSGYFQLELT